jgi:catechol 2,3-dioxygenase-like lactoylglutathione lyase family enzyme
VQLDHTVISVSDWDRSNAFYRAVFGVEVEELEYGRVAYRFGNVQVNVHGPGSRPDPAAGTPLPPGASHLCVEWPGPVATARAHLERCGVEIELGPSPRTGGRGAGQSLYFRDPDGSLLELISYP